MLDGAWISGQHLQVAHNAESTLRQECDVVGFHGAGVACFDGHGGRVADDGGVIVVLSGPLIFWGIVGGGGVVGDEGGGPLVWRNMLLGAGAARATGSK